MPEGDTIRRLADRLAPVAVGRRIERSLFRHNRWATTDLSGLRIAEVDAIGKHLLMRLHDEAGRHRVSIGSHLRMSGRWTVGIPPRTPAHRRRVELWLDSGRVLVGTDLPVLEVGRPRAEQAWVGHLGPDLCGAVFDRDQAVANLQSAGARPLGGALLDQRNLAGIGNLYAVEIPFLAGVSPWTATSDVDGVGLLVDLARALLPANARAGPQTTTGLVGRGRDHWVYGRRGRPCPVCRTPLRVADEPDVPWGRVTTWCPGCQSDGATDVARALRLLRRHRAAVSALLGSQRPPRTRPGDLQGDPAPPAGH